MLVVLALVSSLLPPSSVVSARSNAKALSSLSLNRRSVLLGAGSMAATATALPPTAAFAASDSELYFPEPNSLSGTTIMITGANTGLGLESAKRLAAAGARIVVAARSKAKADAAVQEIAASTTAGSAVGVELDLADLASVKSLPSRLDAALGGGSAAIDVLMNNAGVMAVPERLSTADGFEKTVGINHLGHFALVAALMPYLQRAKAGFRIINVSSDAHRFVDKKAIAAALKDRLDPNDYAAGGWGAYGLSKAANVLFTVELERRLLESGAKGSAVTMHPGVVQTDLGRYIIGGVAAEDAHPTQDVEPPSGVGAFLKSNVLDRVILTVDKGANTQIYLAAAADTGGDRTRVGGLFFDKMKEVKATDAASDPELAKELWRLSEELTGTKIAL